MRDRLHAPIVWERDAGGYHFENVKTTGPAYELPGLWFSAGELYALLAAHKLLGDIERKRPTLPPFAALRASGDFAVITTAEIITWKREKRWPRGGWIMWRAGARAV